MRAVLIKNDMFIKNDMLSFAQIFNPRVSREKLRC